MPTRKPAGPDTGRLDRVVAEARQAREQREHGYRAQALKLFPWVCARCAREFDRGNVHELTVHHRNHDHDHNPADGSNWELLCLYCHDDEHQRLTGQRDAPDASRREREGATHSPFAGLASLLHRADE